MELLFNLIWCALAIVALLAPRAKHGRGRALLALACAALLVFPAISISDDLHVTSAPFEEANKKRLDAVHWASLAIALPAQSSAIDITTPQVLSGETVSEFVASMFDAAFVTLGFGRDPPSGAQLK